MRNSSSLDWLRFMHTPNDYRVSQFRLIRYSWGIALNHDNRLKLIYFRLNLVRSFQPILAIISVNGCLVPTYRCMLCEFKVFWGTIVYRSREA